MASVAQAVEELMIDQHGAAESILTDDGCEFASSATQSIQDKYGIEWKYGTAGHHQTVGAVERAKQTLFNNVKKISDFGQAAWGLALRQATLAASLSFNGSMQTSPFIMRYGRLADLDIDRELGVVGWSRTGCW